MPPAIAKALHEVIALLSDPNDQREVEAKRILTAILGSQGGPPQPPPQNANAIGGVIPGGH